MPAESEKTDSGLSIQTLVIASAASVAAAIFVHEVWEAGAIFGAAITPIIVAVVSESLKKPARRLTAVRPVALSPTRRPAPRAGGSRREQTRPPARGATTRGAGRPREDRFGIWEAQRPSWRDRLSRRHLKIALATGALAFVIGALTLTGGELVLGGSVGGGDRPTLAGGGEDRDGEGEDGATTTPADEDAVQEEPAPSGDPADEAPQPAGTTPAPGEEPVPAEPEADEAPAAPDAGATPAPEQQPPAAQPTP